MNGMSQNINKRRISYTCVKASHECKHDTICFPVEWSGWTFMVRCPVSGVCVHHIKLVFPPIYT